jgi:hypothetical protein
MRATHLIMTGCHRHGILPVVSPHRGIAAQLGVVRFYLSCWYDDSEKYDFWNKLPGWTTDLLGIDSIRPAFRPVRDNARSMWLGLYMHEGGARSVLGDPYLGQFPTGVDIYWSLSHNINKGTATLSAVYGNQKAATKEWPFSGRPAFGWRTGVYIGGRTGAPHPMGLYCKIISTTYR